ncbi:hypothetical protein BCh11DRAFT_00249 [Burkholderia sp. Ch1-1]|nr:hypothetical protein BCh11DRAFT_00249 [Burkholderia sp. Ch1-1]
MEYRIRATGAVVSEAELRAAHPDSVLPSPLTADALEFAGAVAVLEAPAPPITATQTVARNGVTQDAGGNWVTAWVVTDMSADQVATMVAGLKNQMLAAASAISDQQFLAVKTGTPQDEVLSWTQQMNEANAYKADASASTPLLTALATARGITLADLAQRVISKAAAYTALSGAIIGRRQAIEDSIGAVTAIDAAALSALDSINVNSGWPLSQGASAG